MKNLFLILIGIVLGVFGTLSFQNPQRVGNSARGAITKVERGVTEVRRQDCTRDFLERTHCFQKQSANECDALLVKECGLPQ